MQITTGLLRLRDECKRVEKTFPYKKQSIFEIYYLAYHEIKEGALEENEINQALQNLKELEKDLAEIYLVKGTQIVYAPRYANGNVRREHGFVTSISRTGSIFCRFFRKSGDVNRLRTRANSESCSIRDLIIEGNRPQKLIEMLLKQIENNCVG